MNHIKLSLEQIAKKFGNDKFIGKYSLDNELSNDFSIQLLEDNDQYNFYRCILSQISDEYQFAFTNESKLTIIKEFIDKLIKNIYLKEKGNKLLNSIGLCNFNISIDILNIIQKCYNINIIIIKNETKESFIKKYNNLLNFKLETINYVNSNINDNFKFIICLETNNLYLPIIFKETNINKMKDFINYIFTCM